MAPNSLCRELIVYGSYAPGGANHSRLAHIKGEWTKGKILADLALPPDGIAPGQKPVLAWSLRFADYGEEMFLPEGGQNPKWAAQRTLLFDHWQALDAIMGPQVARHECRWWPEGDDPIMTGETKVLNIYLPVQFYPYLARQSDPVHPDDRMNHVKLWYEVRTGAKAYDTDEFTYLLADSHPDYFDELFGELPKGTDFIARLNRLVADAARPGITTEDAYQDRQQLSMGSPRQCTVPPDAFQSLVIADLGQRMTLLRENSEIQAAGALSDVSFQMTDSSLDRDITCDAGAAFELSGDLLLGPRNESARWLPCLIEACRGMTRDEVMPAWMIRPWFPLPIDLEPAYEIWKSGGSYWITDGVCHISRETW